MQIKEKNNHYYFLRATYDTKAKRSIQKIVGRADSFGMVSLNEEIILTDEETTQWTIFWGEKEKLLKNKDCKHTQHYFSGQLERFCNLLITAPELEPLDAAEKHLAELRATVRLLKNYRDRSKRAAAREIK